MSFRRAVGLTLFFAAWVILEPAALVGAQPVLGKPELLRQLTRSIVSRVPERAQLLAAGNADSLARLGADLIVYRWMCRQMGCAPDVRNLNPIVNAIQKSVKDSAVDWAAEFFPANGGAASVKPPDGAADIESFVRLKGLVEDAAEDRHSSPAAASESLAEAVAICQNLELDLCEAVLSRELGDIYQFDMARYRQAEAVYYTASSTFQAYFCAASTAAVFDNWARLSVTVGRYNRAAERYIQAARQWEELIKLDPSQFRNRDKAGLAYMNAGTAKEAAGDYGGALELMRSKALFQLRNYAHATRSYEILVSNLLKVADFVLRYFADSSDALALLNEARDAAAVQKDPLLSARVFGALADFYSSQGSSNAAFAVSKRAAALWEAARAGDSAARLVRSRPGMPRAELKKNLVQVERAAAAYSELKRPEQSADLWRQAAAAYGAAGMIDEQINCLQSLAGLLDAESRPDDALEARREAVTIARITGRGSVAAEIMLRVVQAFREKNDEANALDALYELVPLAAGARNSRLEADALEARGTMLAETNHHVEAVADFRAALDRLSNLVGDVWAAGRVALRLAASQTALNLVQDARATLADALNLVESAYAYETTRAGAYPDHTRLIKDLYFQLAANHVGSSDLSGAEAVVRRTLRYPWFADFVRDLSGSQDPKISAFARSSDLFRDSTDQPSGPAGARMLADDGPGYVTSCWKIKQGSGSSYLALPVDPLSLYRARGGLPKDTLAVVYLPSDYCIYAFVLGRDKAFVWQLDQAGVDDAVTRLRRIIEYCEQSVAAGIPVPPVAEWQSPAFLEIKAPLVGLYEKLIKPLNEVLRGAAGLIFCLPPEYEGLPMHALIASEESAAPRFLLRDYRISFVGRGMIGDVIGEKSREIYPGLDSLAIFADPEDNLPGSRREAAAIRAVYPNSRHYVGSSQATASSFLAEWRSAGILHIAAHNRVFANPYGVQIIFAPDSRSDGIIGIRELSEVEPDSLELVVLSACDTLGTSDPISSGPVKAAELFSIAGARSVLGSLWKVSDEAAVLVFTEFYRNIAAGKSRTEALRLAQLSVIESRQYAHPFYWACFTLYGNPR